MPTDRGQAMQVLDALTGTRGTTNGLLSGSHLPGAQLAGPSPEPVRLAQAPAGTMSDGRSAGRGIAGPGGVLVRRFNSLLTASELLQQIQRAAERAQVEAALLKFGMSRNSVADVYAARAYVWARNMAPMIYWSVPYSGQVNERVAVAIMRHERDNPGTLGLMTRGNGPARAAIDAIVATAVAGTGLAGPVVLEKRRSAVADPELSTDSNIARVALGISGNQSWIAHHLIPFAVVRDLPVQMQRALAACGWRMDSIENLVALPRNLPTYLGPTNLPRHPWHAGSHPIYSADVAVRMRALAGMTGPALRGQIAAIELFFRRQLITNVARYHQMLR